MKLLVITLLTFQVMIVSGQIQDELTNSHIDRIMFGEELEEINRLDEFKSNDFSEIWTLTPNRNVLGIIGEKHKRLKIKLISVSKTNEGQIYMVKGRSSVDGNIVDFDGSITIREIGILKELHFGVDNEYKDSGIKSQGLLIAEYQFSEKEDSAYSGIFKGQLYSKWYLNSQDETKYDDIQSFADGYINNAFVGTWTSYKTKKSKICNWGDYRILGCNSDFDIGAGEFSPSKKYESQGWENYQQAWLQNDKVAQEIELDEWWR
ncbi:hypothetical protein N9L92_00580 [Saprospiraceae bacterium]|nr:hypothetical protein [Saprospiraceae bacterium]